MASEVGNGSSTLFWTDRWLHGKSINKLAPRLFAAVSVRRRKDRTVLEALTNMNWVLDITGALTVGVLIEYLQLWDLLEDRPLQPDVEDVHYWRLSLDGRYSAMATYESLFQGATQFGPWERIWKSCAPPKCRFFLWLVAHKRCWTVDRLARHGLPHKEQCLLCDQEEESIDHLLVSCVFSRQFWFHLFRQVGLQAYSPQPGTTSFFYWCENTSMAANGLAREGINSLIVLGAWILWNIVITVFLMAKHPT
ncbi:hypothetical protein PR202_gb23821 [Eleusine coracana subsp. coracana]|uniref:Reverse transcriptase zinc-binding domain-containing protein n=1 Tax=Eleusine coracana subsp. coracana TaxID=191504 RepID=A0AAV5FJL5_ELECO|nr:hypothetical protein PR202_gb23821 [Eleusine coracana subsp. coracana]